MNSPFEWPEHFFDLRRTRVSYVLSFLATCMLSLLIEAVR